MVRFKAHSIARVCGIAMAASVAAIATTTAYAADPPEKWLPLPDFKQRYTDLVSGWYLRGDMGWRKYSIDTIESTFLPVTAFTTPSTGTLGFGGGYKYKWFRADITLDYGLRNTFRADTAAGVNYYTAKIDSFTLLANIYLDLGNWSGFTPYIGVGGGTTQLRTDEVVITGIVPLASQSKWNTSWALMGGVGYQFTPNMLLDVGYRYVRLGDAVSGPETLPSGTGLLTFRDMTAQEIRVGLRLLLD